MKQLHHIHIFGASGSGTTTIAKQVSERLQYQHFDSDQYFWMPTETPFTVEREREECLSWMLKDLTNTTNWILSGSIVGWGEILASHFECVVFVYVPKDIRIERLKKREYERYGNEILPGGARYKESQQFLEWAAAYDAGTRNGRSLPKHEAWLKTVECPILRVMNDDLDASVRQVIDFIG